VSEWDRGGERTGKVRCGRRKRIRIAEKESSENKIEKGKGNKRKSVCE
jgi:hypothetical protein